jgi:hypothetical protein
VQRHPAGDLDPEGERMSAAQIDADLKDLYRRLADGAITPEAAEGVIGESVPNPTLRNVHERRC